MAYDGLFAGVCARQLAQLAQGARIEKVQQPEPDTILMQLNTAKGRKKLLICTAPQAARVQLTELTFENPQDAPSFCMLLRKHIQGGRISGVRQVETERIIEFDIETVNEMGYAVSRRLIAETMGKHSNIVLLDIQSGKIIDSIKRISIDVNRYRQILPGFVYVRPPRQDKKDLWTVTKEEAVIALTGAQDPGKALMSTVQGLGPTAADEICVGKTAEEAAEKLSSVRDDLLAGRLFPAVYCREDGTPQDVHVFPLSSMAESLKTIQFDTPGEALDYFYSNRRQTNRVALKAETLAKNVRQVLDKHLLKKQRLLEDIQKAEGADLLRLKGELLTANLHLVKPGAGSVKVTSYYDGTELNIELDERFSASKNAQLYYKRYAKAKTAKKEKMIQLAECNEDIDYLESAVSMIDFAADYEELELIRSELIRLGYMRARKAADRRVSSKPRPRRFMLKCGYELLVGRNNTENDFVTFKMASKTDLWFHTKDIHGSHCVLLTKGEEMGEAEIYEAAAAAAWFSQARNSENVPVDYVPARYVKKPSGAKPGMVIFTNNRTVWIDPADPAK